MPPSIGDDAVLSRRYFDEAVALNPADARIAQAQSNVGAFNASPTPAAGDRVMMGQSRFASMACHQKAP